MNMRPYALPAALLAFSALVAPVLIAPALAAPRITHKSAAAVVTAAPGAVQLEVGASQTLSLHGAIVRANIDTAGVLSTHAATAHDLVITGLAPGHAVVTLGSGAEQAAYDVTVVEQGTAQAEELRRRVSAYPGLANVKIDRRGDQIVLLGRLDSLEDHVQLMELANGLAGDKNGGKTISDLTQVADSRMVAVDVHFYAISETTLNTLGLNFNYVGNGFATALLGPASGAASFIYPGKSIPSVQTPLQNAFSLFAAGKNAAGAISALSEVGLSEDLAKPTLVVRSGEQADFLAGGEIPIPVPQSGAAAGTITIVYKPYGVRLEVAPVVLNNHRILLKLAPEVSELDQVNKLSIQGFDVPAILRRSTNTTVELGDGESYVIAGLTYATNNSTVDRVPGLGNLPVIGALFRRAQTSGQKQQLIIVATPHLVAPLPAGALADALPNEVTMPTFGQLLTKDGTDASQDGFGLKR